MRFFDPAPGKKFRWHIFYSFALPHINNAMVSNVISLRGLYIEIFNLPGYVGPNFQSLICVLLNIFRQPNKIF